MRYRTPSVALAALALSAFWVLVHLIGVGGWAFQFYGYRFSAPVLLLTSAWLSWRTARLATRPGARRFSLLAAASWTTTACGSTIALAESLVTGSATYPSGNPVVQLIDVVALSFALVALLSVPVRSRWSASNVRLGLDMAIVMVTAVLFCWYFFVQPALGDDARGFLTAMILIRTCGILVAIFAVVRLLLGGVAEISRLALITWMIAGVFLVAVSVLQRTLPGPHLHFALALWALYLHLLTKVAVAQHRKVTGHGEATANTSAPVQRPNSLSPYIAVALGYALLVVALTRGLDNRSWPLVAGAILLTALVVARQIVGLRDNGRLVVKIDASMQALREAMNREQVLNDLGTGLLTTTDSAQVHRLAAGAAATLVAGCPGARAAIVRVTSDDPDTWTVLHAAGAGAEVVAGVRLASDCVPDELLARLADGQVISGPGLTALGVAGLDTVGGRPVTLFPLLNGARFFGIMTVSADGELPEDVLKSLQTLRTQVSLALGSVALTEELTRRATHDMLTGLGNRALLRDRLTAALARARRNGRPTGVLLLDLNGFKPINDTYGHDAGDLVLQEVAQRLRDCMRTEDTVARLGGDEFVILAEDLLDVSGALTVADRVVQALNEPMTVNGHELRTPASIGIALSYGHSGPDDVLRHADTAMYVAKRRGGGCYHVHETVDEETAISSA
ncbi:GGDEF domain-containing protein [Actinoplanes sp. NEAU-A12]|uniref:GGDEF domain-containing protein n=1 Tax=Actinoplanes sandaracinus TaxID=3045177 RepID=A0ABT6WYL5_9ACTN|nr:GGDEF domain-containing protein [Actinoplanes sandaracinus]MDI6104832.1 GGDEF domain-containing protein [Actinoplanes sandaracinus]